MTSWMLRDAGALQGDPRRYPRLGPLLQWRPSQYHGDVLETGALLALRAGVGRRVVGTADAPSAFAIGEHQGCGAGTSPVTTTSPLGPGEAEPICTARRSTFSCKGRTTRWPCGKLTSEKVPANCTQVSPAVAGAVPQSSSTTATTAGMREITGYRLCRRAWRGTSRVPPFPLPLSTVGGLPTMVNPATFASSVIGILGSSPSCQTNPSLTFSNVKTAQLQVMLGLSSTSGAIRRAI